MYRGLLAFVSLVALSGCASVPELGLLSDLGNDGKPRIVVHLKEQRAYLYRGAKVVGISPASTGREGFSTPRGKRAVLAKDIDHRSNVYGKYVIGRRTVKAGVDIRKNPKPAGATFVGAPMPYYLQIAPAYGLHAGQVTGYPASHGCIQLPSRWAKRFYEVAKVGTPVIIK